MTNRVIENIIQTLNAGSNDGLIHLRALSDDVDLAKVWIDKPSLSDSATKTHCPSNFYFIKRNGKYIGAVEDRYTTNLHWYISEGYRGKGYLTLALKEIILPHLFQDRNEQRVTIEKSELNIFFESSEKVTISLGFEKNGDNEYLLKKENFNSDELMIRNLEPLDKSRVDELKRVFNYLGGTLLLIQSEVEIKTGESVYSEDLKKLAQDVLSYVHRIDDTLELSNL